MKRSILSIVLIITVSTTMAIAANRTYVNPRFGTTITYPDALFTNVEPDALRSDKQQWTTPDGANLTVWGQNNVEDHTPTSIADFIAKSMDQLILRKIGAKWMVISGLDKGVIVYHRVEFGANDVLHKMELSYSPSTRQRYDRLAAIIAESLIGP